MNHKKTVLKYFFIVLLTGLIVGYCTWWVTAHSRDSVLNAAMADAAQKAVQASQSAILGHIAFDTDLYGMSCWRSTIQSDGSGAEHVEADTWSSYIKYANPNGNLTK